MKLGLVLDGGGAKGAYQIGVWKAMREFGLDRHVTAVAGTSVGGLNAALFTQGDFNLAYRIWTEEINQIHVLRLQQDLSELIDKHIDFGAIRSSPINCFLATQSTGQSGERCERNASGSMPKKYINGEMTYYNLRVLDDKVCHILFRTSSMPKAVMLATSALPILCRQVLIGDRLHRDGGVGDNSSVYPLTWGAECDTILAIHLNHLETAHRDRLGNISLLEIVPQMHSKELGLLNGTLNFSPAHAKMLIDAGYRDSKVVFQKMVQHTAIARQEEALIMRRTALEEQRQSLPLELRQLYTEIIGRPPALDYRREDL